jgi:cobalt-zinc-cadmium efflux system outer membrane protein
MRIGRSAVALCAVACVQTAVANAQDRTLTLTDVLARARERAPQIVSARLALEETRGRLVDASLRFQNNPEIDAALGNRRAPDGRFTDVDVGLGQTFEPGARRTARVAGANAAIAQSAADVDAVTRLVLRDAAAAYYRAIHADLRIRLLTRAQELATGVHSAADRRFKAGDIAVLNVNIARASLARVRADREAAEAVKTSALGDLKQLLRIEEDVSVAGELTPSADVQLPTLLQAAAQRPELRALEAGVQEAEADVSLGRAFGKPEYGVGVRYAREEGDHILLGGLTLTLPVFSKGQELRAVGAARAARLRAELDAARARVQLEVRSAFEAYSRRLAAVRVLETEAIPGLDENETLTARSFEVGQIGLPELLLIRREILDTRAQYLDALMEAALARIDLDASAAILR